MVKKVSRRLRDAQAKVENKAYEPLEALTLLKELATAKFDETAEAHIRLGIDPKYTDQQLRTTVSLPKGTGRTVRVAVITRGEKVQEANNAGADIVGSEELIEEIAKGMMDFEVRTGIVHVQFGKASFSAEDLLVNLKALQETVDRNRPSGAKGRYWRTVYVSSSMGPSIQVDISTLRDLKLAEG